MILYQVIKFSTCTYVFRIQQEVEDMERKEAQEAEDAERLKEHLSKNFDFENAILNIT